MKTKSFALSVTILLLAFLVNTSLMAQSNETKQIKKETKTVQPKIESNVKTNDVHQTADTAHQKESKMIKTKENIKSDVKRTSNKESEVKKTADKETKKTVKEMIHHKMPKTTTEKTKKVTK